MTIPDVRTLSAEQRRAAAARAHGAYDVTLPPLALWNDQPCGEHEQLTPGCQRCGVVHRRHQRIGAAWLYFGGATGYGGLLGDSVGLGKTITVATVIALAFETGELSLDHRVVVVTRAAAVRQWVKELRRLLPALIIWPADGTVKQRRARYVEPWHIVVIGPEMLTGTSKRRGDIEHLYAFPLGLVVYDDTDGILNHENKQAAAIKRLARRAPRRIGVHATPVRKRLSELHSMLEPLGGDFVLGTKSQFQRRHVETGNVYFYQAANVCAEGHLTPKGPKVCLHRRDNDPDICRLPVEPDPTGRKVRRSVSKETGIIDPDALKAKIAPLVLRRRAVDCDDVTMPAIQPAEVWLDPTPAQKARYEEIREGAMRRLNEAGQAEISHVEGMAAYTRAWQCCSGLAALDGAERVRGSSAKLDWLMTELTGDLAAEKTVVFIHFTPNVAALSTRLTQARVDHVKIWGPERSSRLRAERMDRFNNDPNCKVLIGTTSIEQSLNLQVSRHLVCVDVIRNPARMEQLAGRVARIGSVYQTVYVHFLMLRGTVEEDFLPQLDAEAGMSAELWGDTSALFNQQTGRQILEAVARQR